MQIEQVREEKKNMKITLFKKERTTKEGRKFNLFVGNLKKKDGTEQYVTVKTSGQAIPFNADKCPYIIEMNKEDCNMQTKQWTDKNGEVREDKTLWVKAYKESTEKYVDHSLDEFE